MELAFVLFTGPTAAVCQPLYSHVLFRKTPRRTFLRSVRAWERLLLLAMGLDTKPLVNLIPFVAWAARKLGAGGGEVHVAQRGLSRDPRDILGNVLTFPQSHPPPTFLTMTLTCSSEASPTAGLTGLKTFAAPCKAMVPGRVLSKLPGHLFEKNTPSLGVSRVRGWPLICSDARPEAGPEQGV